MLTHCAPLHKLARRQNPQLKCLSPIYRRWCARGRGLLTGLRGIGETAGVGGLGRLVAAAGRGTCSEHDASSGAPGPGWQTGRLWAEAPSARSPPAIRLQARTSSNWRSRPVWVEVDPCQGLGLGRLGRRRAAGLWGRPLAGPRHAAPPRRDRARAQPAGAPRRLCSAMRLRLHTLELVDRHHEHCGAADDDFDGWHSQARWDGHWLWGDQFLPCATCSADH